MAATTSSAADFHLQEDLEKIRPHVSSALANQKAPALLLVAIEDTLKEQQANLTPVAYFAALVSTLEQTLQKEKLQGELSLGDGDVVPALLYLLAIAVPRLPVPVLRSRAQPVIAMLGSLLAPLSDSAPALRSLLGIFQAWIPALENSQLSLPILRQSFATIIEYTLDPRPKVRKKAQDVIQAVLSAPPPPANKHPYSSNVADFIIRRLDDVGKHAAASRAKAARGQPVKTQVGLEAGMWCCAFVKSIASYWPAARAADLVNSLLRLPALASNYLTSNAYDLLAVLLSQSTSQSSFESGKIPSILAVILSSQPAQTDQLLASSWLRVVEQGMVAYATDDPDSCSAELFNVWKTSWRWFEVNDGTILSAASEALCSMARYCIPVKLIQLAVDGAGIVATAKQSSLVGMIALCDTSLSNINYVHATPHILRVVTALLSRLRVRLQDSAQGRPPSSAQLLMPQTVMAVGGLRTRKGFEHRERADDVLGMAIEVLGPETVLELLPLNLEPERLAANEGRAYLLPLLRNRVTNARLSHFVDYFVPLSERLFDVQAKAEEGGRMVEQKIYSALVEQIWACFPAYCDMPFDLKEGFTNGFAHVLTQVLYSQPSMRAFVLRGLQRLVETNTSLAVSMAPTGELSSSFGIDQPSARGNVEFLRGMAGTLLSIFFNVFGSVDRDARGLVGDVISTYLAIADVKVIASTYEKVLSLLKQDMANGSRVKPPVSVAHTMLDLLIIFVPHLPPQQAHNLFSLAASGELLESHDPAVQKKSYRLLTRLLGAGKVFKDGQGVDVLMSKLTGNAGSVASAAKRDRISLYAAVVPVLPPTQLHFIAMILPEAVLGTKEVNEGARNEAFELLVRLGSRMSQGGTISRSQVEDIEDATDVAASVEEFFTMVAAGLAGATPHMISASITALSRLIFDFKDSISIAMKEELISTVVVYVGSTNREIVKSALGFVKVIIVALPVEVVRPHLPTMVPALMNWSHDHKNHFKGKVRHIFERLIRKFGFDQVYKEADEEHRKVLSNIKKQKDRARRKRANAEANADESGQEEAPRATTGNAFEDALYGSESELDEEESDNDRPTRKLAAPKRGGKDAKHQRFLRLDDDDPTDLLQGASTQITTSASGRRRKPGQDAATFKTDDSGRLVINQDEDEDMDKAAAEDVEGTAYRETLTSADGFTRGRRGEVKFNKDTKKRRAAEAEDIEMADAGQDQPTKKRAKMKREPGRLGQEFKAKNAQGDTRKGGQHEPYAYMPLAQAGSKKGRQSFNVKKRR